ncbi:MAG: hypothetical protein L3K19_04475 [Thermoplasmata archaeon]|nr:hypothetical protein [Thermoplasmata archaeon]
MQERARNRAIYIGTIASMLALTAGFVLAATVGTIPAPPAQGGAYTAAGTPPANVATTGARLTQAAATGAVTTNSLASPHVLTVTTSSGSDALNMNAISTVGDYVQTITITLTAGSPSVAANTEYSISLFIAGATGTPQLLYVETSATFGSGAVDTLDISYDMGSGSSGFTITAVSDLITQCSAVGTC